MRAQADTLNASARLLRESNGDVKAADAKLRPVRFSVVLERQRSRLSSHPDGVTTIEEVDPELDVELDDAQAPLFADADADAVIEADAAFAHSNPNGQAGGGAATGADAGEGVGGRT